MPFVKAFEHGTMNVELFAPSGEDLQTPHNQDELYIVIAGDGEFVRDDERLNFTAGDVLFVPAGMPHRFENFSEDFVTWVVFYGEKGGEKDVQTEKQAPIFLEIKQDIAIIHFNRPKERNPLSVKALEKLDKIISSLTPTIRAFIFIGRQDVFASGANLREIAALRTEKQVREFGLRGQNLMRKIAESDKLTIAAVNGYCFGGALDLALACKMRIASPNASFSHPGANLGIMTGWGGTQRLPRLVGEAAALEMFLTAKRVDANEALQIGLVNQISESPLETALAIAVRERAR